MDGLVILVLVTTCLSIVGELINDYKLSRLRKELMKKSNDK